MKACLVLLLLCLVSVNTAPSRKLDHKPTFNEYIGLEGTEFVLNQLQEFQAALEQNLPLNDFYKPLLTHLNRNLMTINKLIPKLETVIETYDGFFKKHFQTKDNEDIETDIFKKSAELGSIEKVVDDFEVVIANALSELVFSSKWMTKRIDDMTQIVQTENGFKSFMSDDAMKLTAIQSKVDTAIKSIQETKNLFVETFVIIVNLNWKKDYEMSIEQHTYLPKLKGILDNKEFVTLLVQGINQVNQLIHERDDDEQLNVI